MAGDFQGDIERLKASLADRAQRFVRASARALANEVIAGGKYSPGTPIDTGFHRSHWDAALGSLPVGGDAGSEGAARERVEAAIDGFGLGQTITIANNGPAIRRLEFDSWSQQAPDGFVRPAVEAAQQIVDEVAIQISGGDS